MQSSSGAGTNKTKVVEVTSSLDDHSRLIIEVKKLMSKREKARESLNYSLADSIRDQLNDLGVDVQDQKGGSGPAGWKFKDGSTKKLPSGITLPASTNEESSNSNKRKREDVVVAKAPLTTQKTATSASPKSQNVVKSEDKRLKANLEAVIGTQNSKSNTKNIDGVIIEEIKLGTGRKAQKGERLKMMYVGKLKSNDRIFDASKKPFSFRLGRGEVIRGWDIGCEGMSVGGKRKLTIPPQKGYGKAGAPPTIPGNATLVFDISLVEIQ